MCPVERTGEFEDLRERAQTFSVIEDVHAAKHERALDELTREVSDASEPPDDDFTHAEGFSGFVEGEERLPYLSVCLCRFVQGGRQSRGAGRWA